MSTARSTTEAPIPHGRDLPGGRSVKSRISRWLVIVLWPIHRLLMWLYFHVDVSGAERIARTGPVILVPTHRSRWDPVVLYCATPRLLRFMASHDEFIGLQGWFMRHMGTFPVNTQRPSASALAHCRELLASGKVLVIFAEGTIFYYPPNTVHPIKPGPAWLALDCQERMPEARFSIVPIRIVYSDRYPHFRTHVQILVQEPLSIMPFLEMPRKEAIRLLTAQLQRALGDVVNESLAEMSPPRNAGS